MAEIHEEELVPGRQMRVSAGMLWFRCKKGNVKKLKAALTDCERNYGLTFELA
jgi:hypothetical protein